MTNQNQPETSQKPGTSANGREAPQQATGSDRQGGEAIAESPESQSGASFAAPRPSFNLKYPPWVPQPSIFYQAMGLVAVREGMLLQLFNQVKAALEIHWTEIESPKVLTEESGLMCLAPFDIETARQMLDNVETVDGLLVTALKEYRAVAGDFVKEVLDAQFRHLL